MLVPHKIKTKNCSRLKEAEDTGHGLRLDSGLGLRRGGGVLRGHYWDIDYCVSVTFPQIVNCSVVV